MCSLKKVKKALVVLYFRSKMLKKTVVLLCFHSKRLKKQWFYCVFAQKCWKKKMVLRCFRSKRLKNQWFYCVFARKTNSGLPGYGFGPWVCNTRLDELWGTLTDKLFREKPTDIESICKAHMQRPSTNYATPTWTN